jgi:nucleoside-diphosphate-sugar epimerase
MMQGPVAVTGGTGLIGREVIRRLVKRGLLVRALTRRHDPGLEAAGAITIRGGLVDGGALARLVEGVTAVVHCAGAVAAPDRATFQFVNGTAAAQLMAVTAAAASQPRFILLSSLAAREPRLSTYAESKRLGEDLVRRAAGSRTELCILRPPAVYGPRDRATLPVFRQLKRGLLFVPATPDARFSLIYVEDLAELVLHLLETNGWSGRVLEPDDGRVGGYRWQDLAEMAGRELGRRVRTVSLRRSVLWPAAAVAQAVGATFGRPPRLSPGKLRELFHSDWVCSAHSAPPLPSCSARTTFESGFARTMAWYERHRWL